MGAAREFCAAIRIQALPIMVAPQESCTATYSRVGAYPQSHTHIPLRLVQIACYPSVVAASYTLSEK